MNPLTLIDTSALLAVLFQSDANHARARVTRRSILPRFGVVTIPVVAETFYMTKKALYYQAAIQQFSDIYKAFLVESVTRQDMIRMEAIMRQYEDTAFDFADVSIMTVAERLNITRIFTFDRRDFLIYRPTHCDHFDLLP